MRIPAVALIGSALYAIALGGLLLNAIADEYQWGYEGEVGPSHWGKLSPEFAPCGEGNAQSPIDIRDATEVGLVDIAFHYQQSAGSIVNNGHTIQVDFNTDDFIIYNGIRYDLLQFHFHSPSEHTIDGEAAAMELHLVHADRNSGVRWRWSVYCWSKATAPMKPMPVRLKRCPPKLASPKPWPNPSI